MKKLKTWQIVLLIIFYPFGIAYLCYKLYKKYGSKLKSTNPNDKTKALLATSAAVVGVIFTILLLIGTVAALFGDGSSNATNSSESDLTTINTPAITVDTSVTTSGTPTVTTAEPVITIDTSAMTTDAPITTAKPSVTTGKPPETTAKPPVTTDKPPVTDTPTPQVAIVITQHPGTVDRNEYATLTIKGKPNTEYKLRVHYSDWSTADGLGTKTSDADGYVTWTWKIGGKTSFGSHEIEITGDGQKVTSEFTVADKQS